MFRLMLGRCYLNNNSMCRLCMSSSSQINKQDYKQKVVIERTITKDDVNEFAKLTGDYNSIHFAGNGIVHGAFLNGLVSGVIGTKLPGDGTIVLSQTLNYPNPCPIGSTVYINVEITSFRKIITCEYCVRNKEDNIVVLQGDAKLMKKKI